MNNQIISIPLFGLTACLLFCISCAALSQPQPSVINRRIFLREAFFISTTTACYNIKHASAIEFVPASPNFKYNYQDGIEILTTQRVACDNIYAVISDGNLNEAAFKIMQLNAQTKEGGKIVLDYMQTNDSSSLISGIKYANMKKETKDAIDTTRLLRSQEKFASLIDLSSECEVQVSKALNGKLGATAPAQLKLLSHIKDLKNALDEFLLEFVEDEVNTSL